MLSPIELAWLAGFADADGCFRLKKGMKNQKLGQNSLIPHVAFHNTCVMTLNKIHERVSKIVPEARTSERKRISKKHARMGNIEIMGMKRCEPLIKALLPYLVTKRLEAELLLRFIERRKTRGIRNKPYESIDYQTYAAIKNLKVTRHLRDYMPSADEILGDDIVRTNAKSLEEAEMSSRLSQEEKNALAAKLVWYRKDRSKGSHQAKVTT